MPATASTDDHSWLTDLLPFIRHMAGDTFGKYPIPSVQDQFDIANTIAVRLLEFVKRAERVPIREHLENKCRYICMDIRRKNHRLGFTVRRGDRAAMVVALDEMDDRDHD